MSDSVTWKDRGNLIFLADKEDMDLCERQVKLKMAQTCYLEAIECAANNDEMASAANNAGKVSHILSGLYSSDEVDNVQIVIEHIRVSLGNFTKAFQAGRDKPEAWRFEVDQSIRKCLNGAMNWTSKFSVKFCLATMEEFISLLPEGTTKAESWFQFAEALFNLAVEELSENRYQNALKYLKDSNYPLEEAKRMKQDLDYLPLESDIYVRICVAEALQVKDMGEELLKTVTMEEEHLKMDLAWQVVDTFREALILIRNQQVEMEAIILSRIGYVYDKLMKMEDRAHCCYREAIMLALTSQFSYNEEGWYKGCQEFLVEYQKKKIADLDKEDEKWREPVKAEMKADLDKLKDKPTTEVVKLLEFIYKTWPPKNKENKLDKNVEGNEKKKKAKMLRQALLHYHPDQQTKEGECLKWFVMCEEICKVLNAIYEPLILNRDDDEEKY